MDISDVVIVGLILLGALAVYLTYKLVTSED